jgi:hypothetical protein
MGRQIGVPYLNLGVDAGKLKPVAIGGHPRQKVKLTAEQIKGIPAGFSATMTDSDFLRSCVIGYGSSPSRCGPPALSGRRSNAGSPRFRRDPFARDVLFDPGRVDSTSHNGTAHVAFGSKGQPPPQRKGYFGAQSHTPRNRCVRFVFGIAAASRNTRFQAACWALPGPDLHRLIAPASLAPSLCHPCARAPRWPFRRFRYVLHFPPRAVCHFDGARQDSGSLCGT